MYDYVAISRDEVTNEILDQLEKLGFDRTTVTRPSSPWCFSCCCGESYYPQMYYIKVPEISQIRHAKQAVSNGVGEEIFFMTDYIHYNNVPVISSEYNRNNPGDRKLILRIGNIDKALAASSKNPILTNNASTLFVTEELSKNIKLNDDNGPYTNTKNHPTYSSRYTS